MNGNQASLFETFEILGYFCKSKSKPMKKGQFEFKQFTICHDKCAMKVGTDGVLLGAWTETEPDTRRILDIGTGSGLIAIMLAQKCNAEIIGVDIDGEAITQAQENGANSPWGERLHFLQTDILDYCPPTGFNLIVSNPPFFENALLCPDKKRTTARHSENLPFDMLIEKAYTLLEEGGLFNVVLPVRTADDFIHKAWERGLNLYRKSMVYTKPAAIPKRTLLSLKKGMSAYPQTTPIYIYKANNDYTDEYRKLTEDYYIHF